MITFKKFFIKTLNESPYRSGDFENPYSDLRDAKFLYKQIVNSPKIYRCVHTLYDKNRVFLYEKNEGDQDRVVFFIPENDDFIYGYVSFTILKDGGVETSGVYNQSKYHGLAQKVYREYLFKEYKYIMSSSRHSPDGESFWQSLILDSLTREQEVVVYDVSTDQNIKTVNSIDDVGEFYGSSDNFEKYRIKIFR